MSNNKKRMFSVRHYHDWRGGSDKMWCGNVGCAWVMLREGIPGDKRVRYQNGRLGTPILKPHPCRGTK